MGISISELISFNLQLMSYVFIVGVLGLLLIWIDKALTKNKYNLKKVQPIKQWGVVSLLLAKLGLMVALTGFVLAGFWWTYEHFFEYMSPGRLAFYSVIIAPAPLLLPMSAKIICKLTGGTVDASQVQGCYFLGLNLNNIVHMLFMSYMLTLLTGGLAVFGLIGSGVWTLVKLF